MATMTEKHAERLNELLRGEISAVETYNQALEKVEKSDPRYAEIERIRNDHRETANELRQMVHQETTEDPSTGSSWWGTWAKGYTGFMKLFGEKASLTALKQGEEHGLNEYEEALEDENISPETANAIRTKYIPQTKRHIEYLDNCECD